METIYLIMLGKISDSFAEVIKIATENYQLTIVKTTEDSLLSKIKRLYLLLN